MNRNILFFPLLFLLFWLPSCDDALEEDPYSTLAVSNVFVNEDGLKKATYGVYKNWAPSSWSPFYRFILSESGHRYCGMGIFGEAIINPVYKFTQIPTTGQFSNVWAGHFTTISRANSIISNANKAVSDENIANTYIAEARFLRGYAYFDLVRNFGGVPLINSEINSLEQSDLIYAARSSVEEVYNFIVEDMIFAESHLPDKWTGEDLGRISAGTAKAMLGKVYLTMAGKPLNKTENYQKAVDKLQEIYGAANEAKYGFGLEDNFEDVFALSNERNKELVLSFGYFRNSASPNASIFPFYLFPRGLFNGDEQTFYGLDYEFYRLFEESDDRRDFMMVDRYEYAGESNHGAVPGDSIIYDISRKRYIIQRTGENFGDGTTTSGLAYTKMAHEGRAAGVGGWGYQTDLIEMRYTDVILCLAEALIETGKSAEALPLINRVRERANATVYSSMPSDITAALRLERRLELTGEFTTVYDIRRWGTLKEEIAAMTVDQFADKILPTYSEKLELYPIPQNQIDANPNLVQNPGY